MTNNEAAKWVQLYIDLAKIDPTTGEAAYLNDDDRKTIEAMEMAINALTAQPDLQSTCNNLETDTISRQAAIDAMANTLWHYPSECYRNLSKYEFAKGLAELGLKSVPPVQPDISEYSDKLWRNAYERGKRDAQPERPKGKWILVKEYAKIAAYKCSECGRNVWDDTGYSVMKDYPFCHCGAEMIGVEDG